MSIFCRLSGKHYWCVPHRSADKRLVQVCYECGAERPVRAFHDDVAVERLNHSLTAAKSEVAKLSTSRLIEEPSASQERVAVGQVSARKFLLLK
jgi:hypothetical protein